MKIKFLIISVLAVATLSFGFVASAQTTDVQALIARLQAQIVQLQAQLQALLAQQGGQTWCHTFTNYLVAGSANGEVSYLQTALTKQGLDVSGDNSGTFGDDTAAAVVSFQTKYGIRQTGTVGPITRAKLNSFYGCGITPTACTPNWSCTAWSTCSNNQQIRTCTDLNNCGLNDTNTAGGAEPIKIQTCGQSQSTITVISPNGGEQYKTGDTVYIRWVNSGVPSTGKIQLQLTDTSFSNPDNRKMISLIAQSTDNTGIYSWTIPNNIPTGQYLIYALANTDAAASQTLASDFSDKYFTITFAPNPIITRISAPAAEDSEVYAGQKFAIEGTNFIVPDSVFIGTEQAQTIQDGNWQTGGVLYAIAPNDLPTGTSYVYIKNGNGKTSNQISVKTFSSQPSITVVSPNGGESWKMGNTYNISWIESGITDNLEIYIRDDRAGPSYKLITTGLPATATNYSWTIPVNFWGTYTAGTAYKIQVRQVGGLAGGGPSEGVYDESNSYFSITQ